jgi:DNA sulfur modification protein DndE
VVIEHIKLSQQAKDQLVKLKRSTGIQHWNVLCRWAFCASIAESTTPPAARIPADSSVEMSWRVFGGSYHEIYLALLKERLRQDGIELTEENLATQFRLHLHRGISYLASDRGLRQVADLFRPLIQESGAS